MNYQFAVQSSPAYMQDSKKTYIIINMEIDMQDSLYVYFVLGKTKRNTQSLSIPIMYMFSSGGQM